MIFTVSSNDSTRFQATIRHLTVMPLTVMPAPTLTVRRTLKVDNVAPGTIPVTKSLYGGEYPLTKGE